MQPNERKAVWYFEERQIRQANDTFGSKGTEHSLHHDPQSNIQGSNSKRGAHKTGKEVG